MTNAIGESLSRLFEAAGAEVKRANYQGDVGLHVAKAVWHFFKRGEGDLAPLATGEDYVQGNIAYDEDPNAKEEIDAINKKIYERSDGKVNAAYDAGRKKSLEAFEEIYKTLGTKFDFYFFESEVQGRGREIVEEGLQKRIFEKSDGAVVFRGEKYGLHTRVFINSQGLPTYEAKELGLSKIKYEKFSYDASLVVTANEITEYFKVLLKAMELLYSDLAEKTHHVAHGVLRLPEGKMSSRTGKVIPFRELLGEVKKVILEKMGEVENKENVAEKISLGAMKYSILKQSIGKDIVFDFKTSLSFEGDSGPYLQYTYARCRSVLRKAGGGRSEGAAPRSSKVEEAERMLLRFPDAIARAQKEIDPHYIATYLSELAQAFNNFYAREKIIGSPEEAEKLTLTEAVSITLKNGLWLLGIEAPEEM
ncbi:MAG: arginine--tRNA ligase, partial [Patescibacteria group bacterium]